MPLQPELVAITAAAVVPPLLAGVIVSRLYPPADRSRFATAVAFLWGAAVAATVASPLNDAAGVLVAAAGGDESRWVLPALAGPAIEELVKATGFFAVALVAPRLLDGVAGGVATGALVGLGFAATENVGYYTLAALQGGPGGLVRAVYLRGVVEVGNHAVFTATTGAGLGWAARHTRAARIAAVAIAFAAAVVLHGLWNGLVSARITAMLCNAPAPDAACAATPDVIDLLIGVPAIEAAFLVPAMLALATLVRRTR